MQFFSLCFNIYRELLGLTLTMFPAKKADVQKMSDRSGVPLDKLIAGLQRITRELLAQGK